MSGIRLSDVLQGLRVDEDLRKLAVEGPGDTQNEVEGVVGGTKEDEKSKIQAKLMTIAGGELAAAAASTTTPLNAVQKPPAGEKVTPEAVHVASAKEVGEVVGEALTKLDGEGRKVAAKMIIEKIASLFVFKTEAELAEIKTAQAAKTGEDHDAAGRIMARAYHDEIKKLAAADIEEIEKAEKEAAAAEKTATEKTPAVEKVAAVKGAELTKEAQAFLDEILGTKKAA